MIPFKTYARPVPGGRFAINHRKRNRLFHRHHFLDGDELPSGTQEQAVHALSRGSGFDAELLFAGFYAMLLFPYKSSRKVNETQGGVGVILLRIDARVYHIA